MSPFVRLTNDGVAVRRRRILISGEPNTRKTTSLLTLPAPRAVVSSPGEKGYDTLPLNDPETLPFIWQLDEGRKQDSHAVVAEVTKVAMECITGKHGKITSFAFDGIHKFFEYIMDSVTDGAWFLGQEFEPKLYGVGYRAFEDFLSRLTHNQLPVVAFTCWAENEGDRTKKPGEKASDIPSHIWPALPGKMAKKIVGEFSVVVHQSLRKLLPTDPEPYGVWQTRPAGEIWGCGLKGPAEVVKRIPTYIKSDYRELERLWQEAEKESVK